MPTTNIYWVVNKRQDPFLGLTCTAPSTLHPNPCVSFPFYRCRKWGADRLSITKWQISKGNHRAVRLQSLLIFFLDFLFFLKKPFHFLGPLCGTQAGLCYIILAPKLRRTRVHRPCVLYRVYAIYFQLVQYSLKDLRTCHKTPTWASNSILQLESCLF